MLGEHIATIRLTIDLNPKVKVFVTREGEVAEKAAKAATKQENKVVAEAPVVETVVEEPVAEIVVEEVAAEVPETKVAAKKTKAEKPVEVETAIEETKAE